MVSSRPPDEPLLPPRRGHEWGFLSTHALVLLALAGPTQPTLRDVAERVGLTERAVSTIVHDLEAEGFLERRKQGRRNRYRLRLDHPLRHELERHRDVKGLIDLFLQKPLSSP
jgi:DNA-binding MarR family transcriptional regulator